MAKLLTPKVLRRGFELFLLVSLVAFLGILYYTGSFRTFLGSLGEIRWVWLLVGIGLASMDWLGGGLRNWILVRHIHPNPSPTGMILSGGMGAWAAYVTPLQSGAAPMTMFAMTKYGVPLPKALTATFMSFVATVAFFAIAGPLAIALGAGRSLGTRGDLLGLSLYDLFLGSLTVFAGLGVLLVVVVVFPRIATSIIQWLAGLVGKKSARVAARLGSLRAGLAQAHEAVKLFRTARGWLALVLATIVSGPSHANKLLSGYVALRAIGVQAHFVDVLLLQTMITFLLYFAPTPGASGIAEVLSAAVMSTYVPLGLVPLYTILWRLVLSYYTIAFGFFVFSAWVRQGLKGIDPSPVPTGAGAT